MVETFYIRAKEGQLSTKGGEEAEGNYRTKGATIPEVVQELEEKRRRQQRE